MCHFLPKHLQNIVGKVYICNIKQKIPNADVSTRTSRKMEFTEILL